MRFGAITHARSPILRAAVIQVMPFPAVEIRIAKGNKGQGLPFMAALVQYPLSFIAAVFYCNGAPYVPLQSMGIMGSHCSLCGPIAVYAVPLQSMRSHCSLCGPIAVYGVPLQSLYGVPLQSMGSHCSLWGQIAVYMQRMLLHCCTRVPLPCDPITSQSKSNVSVRPVDSVWNVSPPSGT
jgi:hypothetical protein